MRAQTDAVNLYDTALKISSGRLRRGEQFDLITEAFQPSHEPTLDGLAVTVVEVIFHQLLIRHAALQHMVGLITAKLSPSAIYIQVTDFMIKNNLCGKLIFTA